MEGTPNWKLNSDNQHTFNGISEKRDSLKMSTVKNPTFPFDLTQIQEIWAYDYPKICRFQLTFSIVKYLIGFVFYPAM